MAAPTVSSSLTQLDRNHHFIKKCGETQYSGVFFARVLMSQDNRQCIIALPYMRMF